jgi:exodeoxyribonuclease VII small subunit
MAREGQSNQAAKSDVAKPSVDAAQAPLSFETGLQQLESIVKEMESGELPLERALELFERGMKLSETCRKQLEEAETRVEILMKRAGSATGEEREPQPFRPDR